MKWNENEDIHMLVSFWSLSGALTQDNRTAHSKQAVYNGHWTSILYTDIASLDQIAYEFIMRLKFVLNNSLS